MSCECPFHLKEDDKEPLIWLKDPEWLYWCAGCSNRHFIFGITYWQLRIKNKIKYDDFIYQMMMQEKEGW